MTELLVLEREVLDTLEAAAQGKAKRGRALEGAALLKPLAKKLATTDAALARGLESHAALVLRDIEAPRLFGLFRRTRRARAVDLRGQADMLSALEGGARIPESRALAAKCVAALCSADPPMPAADFGQTLTAPRGGPRPLTPLALVGAERVDASSEGAGEQVARSKSMLARLRRFAPGSGFEFNDRLRVNSPMAAIEALMQSPPALLAAALKAEELERWMREDCKERELADLLTATRLRAGSEHLTPEAAKHLFIRLLSFSPLREGLSSGLVPLFVGRLTSASDAEAAEIVRALEGLGTESVLEALVRAVYEVPSDARPRVLRALGAVGSPRVLDPLERLALHSTVKADRLEAAAAVVRIVQRSPGARSKKALDLLATSEDAEVKALLAGVSADAVTNPA